MTFRFTRELPNNLYSPPELISGQGSVHLEGREYLIIQEEGGPPGVYELRFKYGGSPFREVVLWSDLLLVGHEGYFYLYDLVHHRNVLALEMVGYFSGLYIHQSFFYVADASGLYCIGPDGQVIWRSDSLGIDGVIISRFTEDRIHGSGECDPPGGWVDFVLELQTGRSVQENIG